MCFLGKGRGEHPICVCVRASVRACVRVCVRVPWILVWRSNHWAIRLTIRGVFIRVFGRCEGGVHIQFTWACIRACVRWNSGLQICVYDFTLLYIYIWCYHNQIMASAPTHSSPGGTCISGSIWLFTPLYRPAWYNSNSMFLKQEYSIKYWSNITQK